MIYKRPHPLNPKNKVTIFDFGVRVHPTFFPVPVTPTGQYTGAQPLKDIPDDEIFRWSPASLNKLEEQDPNQALKLEWLMRLALFLTRYVGYFVVLFGLLFPAASKYRQTAEWWAVTHPGLPGLSFIRPYFFCTEVLKDNSLRSITMRAALIGLLLSVVFGLFGWHTHTQNVALMEKMSEQQKVYERNTQAFQENIKSLNEQVLLVAKMGKATDESLASLAQNQQEILKSNALSIGAVMKAIRRQAPTEEAVAQGKTKLKRAGVNNPQLQSEYGVVPVEVDFNYFAERICANTPGCNKASVPKLPVPGVDEPSMEKKVKPTPTKPSDKPAAAAVKPVAYTQPHVESGVRTVSFNAQPVTANIEYDVAIPEELRRVIELREAIKREAAEDTSGQQYFYYGKPSPLRNWAVPIN